MAPLKPQPSSTLCPEPERLAALMDPVHFHILDRPVQSEPETQTKNVSAFLLPLSGRYASSRLPVQSFQNHSVSVQTLNPEPCNTWLVRVCRNPCLATGWAT